MTYRGWLIKAALAGFMLSSAGTALAQASATEIKREGAQLKQRITSAYKKLQGEGAKRSYDLTAECASLNLAGRPVDEVNRVLLAAGQMFDLSKSRSPEIGPDDLVGGIIMSTGPGYSAVFNIVLRAPMPTDGGGRKVESVKLCNVLSSGQ